MADFTITLAGEPLQVRLGESTQAARDQALAAEASADAAAASAAAAAASEAATDGAIAEISTSGMETPELVAGIADAEGNVVLWFEDGLLAAEGISPTLLAAIVGQLGDDIVPDPLFTDGRYFTAFPAALRNQRGSAPTTQAHLLLMGDSLTERWPIPEGFRDDLTGLGFSIVATGWVGVQSTGKTQQSGSFDLLGPDDELTLTNGTLNDVTETTPSGEYSPEGLRHTFASGDTTAGFTLEWTGRYLTIYHTLNGATFRTVTDGGANNDVALASSGGPGKTTIDAGSEGTHTTVLSRPTATNDLAWFGCFAYSALPGVIVSKMGNGGSTAPDIAGIIDGTTAGYILADILPAATVGSVTRLTGVRLNWLTNDSRTGVTTTAFKTAVGTIMTELRAADAEAQVLYSVPLQHGAGGTAVASYVPGLFELRATWNFEIANFAEAWLSYDDGSPFQLDTTGHFHPNRGGPEAIAAAERRQFWEAF